MAARPTPQSSLRRPQRKRRRAHAHKVKQNHAYTVDEAARLLGVHKRTVRNWIKLKGLKALTDARPTLLVGRELKRFLSEEHSKQKRPCSLDQCYCMRCRAPRRAALSEIELTIVTRTKGNILALCEVCSTAMRKHVALTKLVALRKLVRVTIRQAQPHLTGIAEACVDTHYEEGAQDAQSECKK